MEPQHEHFDVIIVGAGLAGLTAARELTRHHKQVLILESQAQPGGRIATSCRDGVVYEKGALFAFDPKWLDFTVNSGPLLPADHPIGLFHNATLYSGESVAACIHNLTDEQRNLLTIPAFLDAVTPLAAMIGEDIFCALNAFFQVIHPGDILQYVPARRRDSLIRHQTHRFAQGNQSLIEALIPQSGADIRYSCPVTAIEELPAQSIVRVQWETAASPAQYATADRVILATAAPQARSLIPAHLRNSATDFLSRVHYGAGIAAIVNVVNCDFTQYAYIVTPHGMANTVVFHRQPGKPRDVLITAYIVAEKADHCCAMDDNSLLQLVIAELNGFEIGTVNHDNIKWSDIVRWPAVGPIISPQTYERFSTSCLFPMNNVILAGDYTWWDHRQMPYGMQAAIDSGQRAGQIAISNMIQKPLSNSCGTPLAITSISSITDDGPRLLDTIEDGTIAFYGWILSVQPDDQIEQHLLNEAQDGLWAYQQGYSPTSLDSALVMEGLLSTGRHRSLLRQSAQRLIEEFFDHDAGAFWTIPVGKSGRAPYWQGADCPSTAYCGWLLQQIDPHAFKDIIAQCVTYLKRKQKISGSWPGKWFPSKTIPLFYSVRFLAACDQAFSPACLRAQQYLQSQQKQDSSWSGSVIETSAAVLALCHIDQRSERVTAALRWLREQTTGNGWGTEPILEYWFEDPNQRTTFYTRDKGQITAAWATRALQTAAVDKERQ